MYRWLRNTHLLLGLFTATMVLLYGLSAAQMTVSGLWPTGFTEQERTVTVASGLDAGRAAAAAIMEKTGLWGDLTQIREVDGGFQLTIGQPGQTTQAAYETATGKATLKIRRGDFRGMLVALHHWHGGGHETLLGNVLGALVGLVSLGLMTLGGTGVYLWFRIHKERLIGGMILGASLAIGLGLLVSTRMAQ